jgi:PKD repeat protein
MHRIATRIHRHHRRGQRAQGLVEFALMVPLILLLTMIALDFGRVYLGYINLQNMTRVAANFAANNPDAWAENNTEVKAQYQNQIALDAEATNCQLPGGTAPAPTFTDVDGDGVATGLGDNATVGLTCTFGVITPFVSNIVGSNLNVSTEVVFPVKSGMSGTAATGGCVDPPAASINVAPSTTGEAPFTATFTDASGGCPGIAWLWDFGDLSATSPDQDPGAHTFTAIGTYTVSLTVWNAVGWDTDTQDITVTTVVVPPTLCTVPNFTSSGGVHWSAAQGIWGAAGFTTTVDMTAVDTTHGSGKLRSQSLVGGSEVPCEGTIISVSTN